MTSYNLNVPQSTHKTFVHPWYLAQQQQASSTTLDAQSLRNLRQASLGPIRTDLDPSRIGDLAEAYVSLIAQWKGADVFTNDGSTGKTDLVLLVNETCYRIDVKMCSWQKRDSCWYSGSATTVKPPVWPVLVEPEGDIMNWRIRWKNKPGGKGKNTRPHCPEGLENFWKKPSTTV